MKTPARRRPSTIRAFPFLIGFMVLVAAVLSTPSHSADSSWLELNKAKSTTDGKDISRAVAGSFHYSELMSVPALAQQSEGPAIATYTPDCASPKTVYTLGGIVCATATGTGGQAARRRVVWIDPAGNSRQVNNITDDPESFFFTIPTTQTSTVAGETVDNRGKWKVNIISLRSALVATTTFVVTDAADPAADVSAVKSSENSSVSAGSSGSFFISVHNNGPDSAANVVLTDPLPAQTNFVAIVQSSGPQFTCTTPTAGTNGTVSCTIASLQRDETAHFQLVFQVEAGTAANTEITNTATVSSGTDDSSPGNNSSSASVKVSSAGGGGTNSCTVACPDDITTAANTTQDPNDPNSPPGAIVHFSPPSGNEECGVIIVDHCNDCFFPVGATTVTATAATGESCSFVVTVTPAGTGTSISCPADQTANADNNCQASVAVGTATGTGANVTVIGTRSDGQPMYTCDEFGNCTRNTDAPFTAGTTTITWIAYSHDIPGPYTAQTGDEESHRSGSASCTQTVTISDVTPPSITPPPGQTASADESCMAAVPDFTAGATVSDNCACPSSDNSPICEERGDIVVTQDPEPGAMVGRGQHTITLTASDGVNTSTATTTFTVNDTTAPVITCPANIELPSLPGTCNASVSPGVATATDNCDGTVIPTPNRSDGKPITDPFPVGTTTITWTATDSANNSSTCEQTVVVLDNENPQISCPDNITTNTDPGECTATVNPGTATATDNCSEGAPPPTVSGERSDGQALNAPYPKGTTTITWTATDSSGNEAECTQTITVNDAEDPVISCPANMTANTDAGSCAATVDPGTATATDNCSATVSGSRSDGQALNAPYPKGTTTITWTATDGSGNDDSCTQTITVNDAEDPVISCPANISTGTDPGSCSANVIPGTATATDNCDSSPTVNGTRSDGQPLNASYPQGTTTITWTATDDDGNSSSCSQTVTVNDTENPTISCPANVTVYVTPNSTDTSAVVNYTPPEGQDNCGGSVTTQTAGLPSGSAFPMGTTTNTFRVTDASGNFAECSFTVTVLYNFTGFFSPVNNPPVLNIVNAGRTVPVKFSLSGNKGLNIFAANSPASGTIPCDNSAPANELEETNTNNSSLGYSAGSDTYTYHWKTESAWAGTCRQLVVTLNDGSSHVANFKFR